MRRVLHACTLALVLLLAARTTSAQIEAQKDGFFTTSDGIKIHYITLGDTGSWVVLIHGYSDSAQRMWFTTGIAQAIAKTHRVVAIDNRNHGQSDKPQPGGTGRALDTVELMDHLNIQKAHIHGYSMGGGFVGQLLGIIPDRFITAGFGGSGMTETDPELRAKATALDEALPKATGEAAAAMDRFRSRVAASPVGRGTAAPAGRGAAPAAAPPASPAVDLSKLSIPIMAVNGSFDNPYGKTVRLWREVKVFENVILPERTHLTAIGVGAPTPQLYIDSIASFINTYDQK